MSTTMQRGPRPGAAPRGPARDDPRRFARRVKRWTLGFTVAGIGLAWALVSQNVVGATNAAAPAASPSAAGRTSGRATVPSPDFFGAPAAQPQPILGNGGSGRAPVVRGGTS